MNFKFVLIISLLTLLFFCGLSYGIEFSSEDKVLILAPHPDDETIGTAGVIQKALKEGAKVKVVYFTNGDHNELAFIVYEKRLTFRKTEFLHMAEVRRKEAIAAMKSLGLREEDLVFLGYPDFGTLEILTKYWGSNTKPFKNFLTRVSRVPYAECLSANAPYIGESILSDLKRIIVEFKPTKVFVSHPVDTNRDHRALYLFLKIALWDLGESIKQPQIFPYIIHVVGWPRPRGYHPDLELTSPEALNHNEISWQRLELTDEEVKRKHDTISFFKSQIEYDPPYLFTFARKNELFGDYPVIKLKEEETETVKSQDLGPPTNYISGLTYAKKDRNLFIRLKLKRRIDKDFGVFIFLLGYNKNKDFAEMPKVRLNIGIGGLHIKDKKETLFIKDAQLKYRDRSLIIRLPITVLGNPSYILACAKTFVKDLPFDDTAWRILSLDEIR